MEAILAAEGRSMDELDLDAMDLLWRKAKVELG
jgi:hypothetical protein